MNPFPNDDVIQIKGKLFRNAMRRNWGEVIQIYKESPVSHTANITRTGDTALHIAIEDGEDAVVEKLVEIVCQTEGALAIQNDLGNTPLHQAAYLGTAAMCRCIARRDSRLMGIRNGDNETPLFLAVRHGRKEAFYALHSICEGDEGYKYCRGKHGETILHAAIDGEYFDLAFEIMRHYEKLVMTVNEYGLSPLHILANKPSAFRSGSQIGGIDKFIYHCLFDEEVRHENIHNQGADLQHKEVAKYPENYHTCVTTLRLLWDVMRIPLGCSGKKYDEEGVEDEEHSNDRQIVDKLKTRSRIRNAQHGFLPKNYQTLANFIMLISKAMLTFLTILEKIKEMKTNHTLSVQVMEKLLNDAKSYVYQYDGGRPGGITQLGENLEISIPDISEKLVEPDILQCKESKVMVAQEFDRSETPILVAAKNGVVEVVKGVLERFPVAVHDMNCENKNVVLLSVEHRQPHVYKFLLDWENMKETIFKKTDDNGNSALHIAARLGEYRPQYVPGAALQMQWEIKWFQFVRDSMPHRFFPRYNNKAKTPDDIFSETHRKLVMEGQAWLNSTSQSCFVVAALIATVAYPTFATLPGGVKSDNSGTPTLQTEPGFSIFAISSLVAFYFSIFCVIMFLAIVTSRSEEQDFGKELPRKLFIGLTTLYISIGSLLLSFCSAHFFIWEEKLRYGAFWVYAMMCMPVAFLAVAKIPFFAELVLATISKVPRRSSK